MARYTTEKLSFNAGLRYEITLTDFNRPLFENGDFNGNFLEQENDYSNLLPSVGLNYDFTDQVRVKLAYYKAIGRGDYSQIAPAASIDENNMIIREGNPDLNPRRADNFDIALETYLDNRSTILSFGVFRKNIKDEIADLRFFREDGYEVITTTNIGSIGVTGIELNAIKSDFDGLLPGFLQNFGLSANFTFIAGEREVNGLLLGEISAAPRTIANVQLFYQTKKFDARLAYNRTGDQLLNLRDENAGDGFNENVYWLAADQWDFTANYYFLDHFSVFFEARNFTNANRGFYNKDYLNTITDYGLSLWAGITFGF